MADRFVAEIRIFPYSFAPMGWAFCDGQLMSISQNTALFSLLGTYYGGNGSSNFALPDLQGRVAIQAGEGPGLPDYFQGQSDGWDTVTLLQSEIPFHTHTAQGANATPATLNSPSPAAALATSRGGKAYGSDAAAPGDMAPQAVGVTGGSLPHNNLMPYLTLNYCIALTGIFPPRG